MAFDIPYRSAAIALITIYLLSSCAQRVPITGGEKDIAPPRLVKSEPDTFSTHFNAEHIRLEFDEYVNLRNTSKNVLITPVLRYQPNIVANGKRVNVRNLDDSLWPNTTYVIEFNEAVIDITENNEAKGLRYVFSTGDYVDSLAVMGQVKDAYTLEPVEDVFIFLYSNTDDSIPYKEAPRYMGRTDKLGVFHVRNMKAGMYKVFFCSDDNGNYLFDRPNEQIDFLDTLLDLTADTVPRIFGHLFTEDKKKNFLKSYGSVDPYSFYLAYNTKVDSLSFFGEDGSDINRNFRPEYNKDRDSVVYWTLDSGRLGDTIQFMVQADTGYMDTLSIAFPESRTLGVLKPKNNLKSRVLKLGEDLHLESAYPLVINDTSGIILMKDSTQIACLLTGSKAGRELLVRAAWKAESNYVLIFDSASLSDITGRIIDSTTLSFHTLKEQEYGSLEINIDIQAGDGLLLIMNEAGKVLEEVVLSGVNSHSFPYMDPGTYRLKYIVDDNANGKWDRGNYLKGKHAEKVFIYQGSITIRSNWDQVIEWKIE